MLLAKLKKVRQQLFVEQRAVEMRAERAHSKVAKHMKEHDIALNKLACSMESVSSHWNKLSEVMQHNEYVYFSVWSERIRNTLFQYSNKEEKISTIRNAKLKVSMDSVIKVKDQVFVID